MTTKGNKKQKIGRNDPCPCGSGKRYKKCCLGRVSPVVLSPELLELKRYIENETGHEVVLEVNTNISFDAITDFGNWHDMTSLPKILHKPSIDKVHILHELIHLEKFFVDQYSIIATNDRGLHTKLDIFKNIPEDYVAHKILKYEYGLNPIEKRWFAGRNNLRLTDQKVAANLINYHAFCEFCPEHNDELSSFYEDCRGQKNTAFLMAEKGIQALKNMNYQDKDSYNQCADELIRIFAPNNTKIYLSYFSKGPYGWNWNPQFPRIRGFSV